MKIEIELEILKKAIEDQRVGFSEIHKQIIELQDRVDNLFYILNGSPKRATFPRVTTGGDGAAAYDREMNSLMNKKGGGIL